MSKPDDAQSPFEASHRRLFELATLAKEGKFQAALDGLIEIADRELEGIDSIRRHRPRDARDLTLAELGLSGCTIDLLQRPQAVGTGLDRWTWPGVGYAGELLNWSVAEVGSLDGSGPKAVDEVRRALAKVRLRLRGDIEPILPDVV